MCHTILFTNKIAEFRILAHRQFRCIISFKLLFRYLYEKVIVNEVILLDLFLSCFVNAERVIRNNLCLWYDRNTRSMHCHLLVIYTQHALCIRVKYGIINIVLRTLLPSNTQAVLISMRHQL